MERLTYRDGHGEAWYSGGTPADHLHRLADYEETGLTPEQVVAMKKELTHLKGVVDVLPVHIRSQAVQIYNSMKD